MTHLTKIKQIPACKGLQSQQLGFAVCQQLSYAVALGRKRTNQVAIKSAGFTLLELLIALVLIVGILAMGTTYIKRKDNSIRKTFRQFIAINRQLDSLARLRRETYRLVINMNEDTNYNIASENKKDQKNTWWVEKKLTKNLMPDDEEDSTNQAGNAKHLENKQNITLDGFIRDKDFFEKPQPLPAKLTFESLESLRKKSPITQGKAYVYYFPEGQFDIALLKIKGKRVYWSLFIDRLKGELTVFNEKKSLKDFEQ